MIFRNACARRNTLRLTFFFYLFSTLFIFTYICTFYDKNVTYVFPEKLCRPPDFRKKLDTEKGSSENFSLIIVIQVGTLAPLISNFPLEIHLF